MHKAIVLKKNGKGKEEIFFNKIQHNECFQTTIFSIGEFGEKEYQIIPDERIIKIIYDDNI